MFHEGDSRVERLMMVIMALNLALFYYPTVVVTFPLLVYFIVNDHPLPLVTSGKTLFYLLSGLLPWLVAFSIFVPHLQELLAS
jgi:hypothetical protein